MSMKALRSFIFSLAAGLIAVPHSLATPPLKQGPVGITLVKYVDSGRKNWENSGSRPLDTAVWYPASAGAHEEPWRVSIFNAGVNAIDAPIALSPVKLPLILLSHGTGGSAATMAWLAESLAAKGYLVAAVNHHGNTGYEPSARLEGFAVWWDRPKDLSVLIDKLLADPRFEALIDSDRIGVAGFSIGGYTALAAVGARLSYAQWKLFCLDHVTDANCKLPPEAKFSDADLRDMLSNNQRVKAEIAQADASFQDARIKAAFVISPALGPVLTTKSLSEIQVPVGIVVGANDDQAIPDINARPIFNAIPNANLVILPNVTHYTFLPGCNLLGHLFARIFCVDPDEVDRIATHREVSSLAVQFFDKTLGLGAEKLGAEKKASKD